MATRKHQDVSAAPNASAAPAQGAEEDAAGMQAIPRGPGALTASQQAFGEAGAGEEQQLKMQMNMDRQSKAESTLSNVSQKTGDASEEMTKNIK